jgi:twinkle protein
MEEMARRLGKHRCWLVRWPAGCKDAFDTFRQGGPHAVDRAVKNATRYPLDGVNAVTNQQIDDLYRRREGWRYMTGYASLDERLKLADQEGLFICTTGVPGHGKTAFWTSYAGALTIRHEQHMASNPALPPFHTVIMSVEMPNLKIARDLISLHARKPFYPVPARERLDAKEMVEVHLPWVNRHFTFMKWDRTDQQPTISWAINVIVPVVKQTGAKLVIIDPWQEFDDEMPMNWRDTSSRWIKKVLWRLRGLAEELCINLVLVAHPAKMKRDRNGHFAVPGGYDIGESQAFNSVPHVGLTIHRPNLGAEQEADEMDIHCWKMRDILYGRVGKTTCRFDQHTHCLYPRPTVAEAVAGMDAESA